MRSIHAAFEAKSCRSPVRPFAHSRTMVCGPVGRRLGLVLFAIATAFAGTARAAGPQLTQSAIAAGQTCAAVANADASIRACSEIIATVGPVASSNPAAVAILATAYVDRGQAYFGKGEYDRSIADFNSAIRIAPNSGLYYNARGYAYEAKGDRQRALADYDMAIRLVPNLVVAFQNRGRNYYFMGDYDRAIADFSNAIVLVPNAFISYNARALAYEGKGDHDRAIADDTQAIQLNPSYGDAYYTRAVAYAAKGDTAKALADFKVAANLIPVSDQRRGQASARAAELEQQPAAVTPHGGENVSDAGNSAGPTSSSDSGKVALAVGTGKRVALVIGNSAYTAAGKLANPEHDAGAIAAALRKDGFDVTEADNLTRASFLAALNKFSDVAATADWATIYYAGHGLQLDGTNYLIPVEAKLAVDRDVPDEAIPLDRVMSAVSGAKKFGLIVLDACRNNPFLAEMRFTTAARGGRTRGLARVEAHGTTLVEFSAQEGQEALDGDPTGNSPFAAALAKRLATSGLEVGKLLRQVREDVLAATSNQQEPMFSGNIPAEDLFFRPPQ